MNDKISYAYLVSGDCSKFTPSANAYQKLKLVCADLQGKIIVPRGCETWVHPEFRSSVLTYRYPLALTRGVLGKLLCPLQIWVGLFAWRREVVHWLGAPSNEMTFFAWWIAEGFSRKPFVLFCWDPPGISVRDRKQVLPKLRCWLMDRLMSLAVRKSKRMILNLHEGFLVGRFAAKTVQKIATFPNGTNVQQNQTLVQGVRQIPFRLAVNSKFERAKGCFEMAKLFVAVWRRIPKANLVWTGDGIDREETLDYLKREGVPDDYIVAPGWTPHAEALRLLATGVIAVNCYEDVPSLRWNYVLKIPEFMSIGLPLVSVDLPGVREYIKDGVNGFLFPPEDWETAASKVIELLETDVLRETMRERCLTAVEKYDWKAINSGIRKLL